MSRTIYGTARKRSAVPSDRHKRAVAYRHKTGNSTFAGADVPASETAAEQVQAIQEVSAISEEPSVPETAPAEEIPQEETASSDVIAEAPADDAAAEEIVSETAAADTEAAEEPQSKVEESAEEEDEEDDDEEDGDSLLDRFKERRTARKNEKKAQLDWEADLPRNGLFTMLLMPGTAIDRENMTDGPVLGSFAALIVNVIKWAVIGSALVYPVYSYIHDNAYSLVSMNFTAAAKLAFEIALFGFLGEYIVIWTLGFISNILQRAIPKRKLISSVSRGSLGIAFAFGIVLAVMIFCGLSYGMAALAAAAVYSISLFEHGINGCMRLNKNLQLLILVLLAFLLALLGFKYIAYLAPDVLEMIQNIANL